MKILKKLDLLSLATILTITLSVLAVGWVSFNGILHRLDERIPGLGPDPAGLSILGEEMLERRSAFLAEIGGITFLILGVNVLAVRFLGKRLIRRLGDSIECLQRMESGEFPARPPAETARDEIAQLQLGINAMGAGMELRTLEQQEAVEALSQSEARFRCLVEQSPVSIVMVRDLKVLYSNAKHAELHRYASGAEMVGLSLKNMISPGAWERFATRVAARMEGGITEAVYEIKAMRRDGSEFDAMITATRIILEDGPASLGFVQDITERRRNEQEIRRLNEELSRKVDELVETQEELVRREKLAILGQLSGSVGHELRNPLGVMSNAVFYLKMVLSEADRPVKEYLEIIGKEIDHSVKIITDLLDFARTRTPQLKVVTARELLAQSIERCLIPENVTFADRLSGTLPELRVDPQQMVQVLQNLITNAVQAMPAGGTLTVSGARGEKGTVRLEVADTGRGIAPEEMRKIFQPLFTTKAKGIGLGLVLCKNLTEANGGRIEVTSVPGTGATFHVVVPVAPGEDDRNRDGLRLPPDGSDPKQEVATV